MIGVNALNKSTQDNDLMSMHLINLHKTMIDVNALNKSTQDNDWCQYT